MRIFIIEDDLLKLGRIHEYLSNTCSDAVIDCFGSYNSGLRACEQGSPDLVILDMALPTFDRKPNKREGRLRPLGGYDLLSKLDLKDLPIKAIVVTQLTDFGDGDEKMSFSEITSICQDEFPNHFLGSVYFAQSNTDWQNDLQTILDTASI
ncbi:chemotaxis protein CheY [Pseudomonas sp. ABAC21]|nr:chemotaxis protein CheY [Pseudomonas sp. ABAC21]